MKTIERPDRQALRARPELRLELHQLSIEHRLRALPHARLDPECLPGLQPGIVYPLQTRVVEDERRRVGQVQAAVDRHLEHVANQLGGRLAAIELQIELPEHVARISHVESPAGRLA